ncbi:FimV/HubP family polar landmark protein [Uliginosibacterium sp. sgz301328]|uniref:FimV/HubP family polar landmark protein n=1 Tax=Uliginosibacterium sp. sgz301328 TaxID=3243764 RepID=UPI00359D9064
MNTPIVRSTLLAVAVAALCSGANAAGLGRISVFSALGQPLRAEVEIAATPAELETMSARLATPDAFAKANIDFAPALSGVRMVIERRSGDAAVIRVNSDRPFNDPFVDMLVELNWAGGRMLREYTFLLDPSSANGGQLASPGVNAPQLGRPESGERSPAAAQANPTAPRATAPSTPAASRQAPAAARPAPAAAARPAAQTSGSAAAGSEYTVQKGDTLSSIANDARNDDVTQDQMIAALYQANSAAFTGGNINRLRAGRVLKVPENSDAQRISRSEARQIILKASNFDSYRQSVASAAAAGPAKTTQATQSGGGAVSPKIQESVPTQTPSRDQLKISKTQVASAAEAGANGSNARVQALEEDVAARSKALQEANSRVADLEKNVAELQKLLEMKSQGMADLQKQAAAAADASKAAATPAAPATAAAAASAAAASAPEAGAASEPATAAGSAEGAPASAPEAAKPAAPVIHEKVAPAPAPAVEEENFFTSPLALGAILIALLGAGYVALRNRRRQPQTTGLTQASLSELSTSPNSVFGNAGGQTIDTGTSMLHTDFSQSGLSAIDTDEGVDPVAEADVYMAYGRDAQAEEILLDALKNDPVRIPVYLKLLEIYAQRGATKQFENVASDLYAQTGGTGDDWAKAVALGARIDPANPLYQGAGSAAVQASATNVAAAAAPVALAAVAAAASTGATSEESAAPAVTFGTESLSQMRATWTLPGDLNQFTPDATSTAEVVDTATQAATATSPDLNLDFNLDLELPEEAEAAAVAPAPVVADAAEHDIAPLDFSTSLPEFPTKQSAPAPAPENEVAPLEFAASAAPVSAPAVAKAAPIVPAGDQTEFDIGIEPAAEQASLSVVDLETTNFEGNLLDFDFELGDEKARNVPADRSVDLTGVRLHTESAAVSTGGVSLAAANSSAAAIDDIDVDDEISTKLELARAYEEMGDVEGARELLEEVVAGGKGAQQDQARSMLARIA